MSMADPRYPQYPSDPHHPDLAPGPPDSAEPPAGRHGRGRRRTLLAACAVLVVAGGGVAAVSAAGHRAATIDGAGSLATPGKTSTPATPSMKPSVISKRVAAATAKQQQGVVTIVSVLTYQNAKSAGTGMVITPDGEILTNNHVISGSTKVTVTLVSTGRTYRADVVGTDPSDDIAVLQLRNASGLRTAKLGDSARVRTGDAVVGVGNARGTGALQSASGAVTAVGQTITARDESGLSVERLKDLIGVNAKIVSGDSGGPMYNANGAIIGMNTAASQNKRATTTAYVIPIDNALSIVQKIDYGTENSVIHIGLPAFLGVSVSNAPGGGAAVQSVVFGGPASDAGVKYGSVLTSVDGVRVTSGQSLRAILTLRNPGSKVQITWTDPDGTHHSARVTLAKGPAD